jgi:hypothetical protein
VEENHKPFYKEEGSIVIQAIIVALMTEDLQPGITLNSAINGSWSTIGWGA